MVVVLLVHLDILTLVLVLHIDFNHTLDKWYTIRNPQMVIRLVQLPIIYIIVKEVVVQLNIHTTLKVGLLVQ